MSGALELRGVHAFYGGKTALRDVSLSVSPGEVVVLLGANGAGKTTTLRAVSGTVRTTGVVALDGRDLAGRRPDVIARAGIAHVAEGRGTFPSLTVEENLRVATYAVGRSRADLAPWFEMFPRLGERRRQRAGTLSGGEQQMLAISRALIREPRVVLLDEPSLGLAPKIIREVFDALAAINRDSGTSMLIVEQNANLAVAVADRVYVLETGAIAFEGRAADIALDERIRRSYLGESV